MKNEVLGFGNGVSSQQGLKLRPGFKPLHRRLAADLNCQTLAALGATRRYHGATAASLHPGQKAVGACTLDFGGLVCAFHGRTVFRGNPRLSQIYQGLQNLDRPELQRYTSCSAARARQKYSSNLPLCIVDNSCSGIQSGVSENKNIHKRRPPVLGSVVYPHIHE